MVKEETINDKKYYQCDICKFYYKDKNLAKKCHNWCENYNSCNIEIIKNAIDPKKE